MCGIAGFWHQNKERSRDLPKLIKPMLEKIRHRGPDDEGIWYQDEEGLVFGHRRLSIIDLSLAGHQPMHSKNKRYTIIYNGEIYNFKELRSQLLKVGIIFNGSSDTEVLVELIAQEGLSGALEKINGMFAFALWDNKEKCIHLVRDRLGEKSLYWGIVDNVLLFGSELKALMGYPGFKQSIDESSLSHYFSYGYTPEEKTIFQNVHKLQSGHITTIKKNKTGKFSVSTRVYWKASDCTEKGSEKQFSSFEKAREDFEDLFSSAIDSRSIADVPLGCFLSGGIDSTLVAAFMQKNREIPLQTFSVGFDAHGYDESSFATSVAKHLKTDHHTIFLRQPDVPQLFNKLIEIYDEPFGDASQLPTLKVSELAAQQVKVVLTGDGADEVFGGYNRYVFMQDYFSKWLRVPSALRKSLQKILQLSPSLFSNKGVMKMLPEKYKTKFRQERFKKLSFVLEAKSTNEFYQRCVQIDLPQELLREKKEISLRDQAAICDDITAMQLSDINTYLPGDILTKVDRATMSCSLEGRAPFLDHRLVAFGLQLPIDCKIRNGKGKYMLRKTLEKYVPKEYFERPKTGFGLPLEIWLKQELKTWCEDILSQGRNTPFIENNVIGKIWHDMPNKISSTQAGLIWRCLVWIAWWQKYKHLVRL